MKTSDIKGIIPPILTPMNDDAEQTVNYAELRNQVERMLKGGVHGLFPVGTNGEAYILSAKEKEAILETVIDQVKGRVPVYAGTGCVSTRETIEMSHMAQTKHILDDFAEQLADISVVDKPSKLDGRSLVMFLSAKK